MVKLFHKILCPVDFNEASMAALDLAVKIAQQNEAIIYLLHVIVLPLITGEELPVPLKPYEEGSLAELGKIAKERLEGKVAHKILTRVIPPGPPATAVIRAEEDLGVDLVVMATHGRTGVSRFFLGSVAERVLRESHCPVLIVRAGT